MKINSPPAFADGNQCIWIWEKTLKVSLIGVTCTVSVSWCTDVLYNSELAFTGLIIGEQTGCGCQAVLYIVLLLCV